MNIDKIFNDFSKVKALIIGDLMIDRYTTGVIDRISPEAPIPILNLNNIQDKIGGAGNVALNIRTLGGEVSLFSVIGNDDNGKKVQRMLEGYKVDCFLPIDDLRPTTIKNRFISNNQHILRVDTESNQIINESITRLLLYRFELELKNTNVVIIEDYDKGVLHEELITKIIQLCNSKNIPVLVDPKKRNFKYYKNITLLKPNKKELIEGIDLQNNETLEVGCDRLIENMNLKGCLITLSEDGAYLDYNKERIKLNAHKREIVDVCGAGDTVSAVAGMCLALNLDPLTLIHLSNLAGGLVCQYSGVVPINKNELILEAKKIKPV